MGQPRQIGGGRRQPDADEADIGSRNARAAAIVIISFA